MKNWKRRSAVIISGFFGLGLAVTTVLAATGAIGREEEVSGAIVTVGNYCEKVADGELPATDPVLLAQPEEEEPEVATGPATEIESAYQDGEHVNLNLNYSRLGIAHNVSSYLNVRKKPSKDGKIVGKMTKNAGCHVYKVKKGWAKIVSGKVSGYVKSSYLVLDKEAEELASKVGRDSVEITGDNLRARVLPSTSAPIHSVLQLGEEFEIKKENVDEAFLKKIIKKEKISKEKIERAGGMDELLAHMNEFACIMVDDDYAFVSKEYVKEQFTLKRAAKFSPEEVAASVGAGIVQYAMQFLGNPYVWGGESLTQGCDCSGFTMLIYRHFGKSLPHYSGAQAACTRSVSNPQPGDLFFYGGSRIGHVAMYIGGGQIIHASNHRDGIKISNAYYRQPVKIGRVL